jgi:hypothetical protein
MANKNWPRWIFASLADHLKKVALGLGLPSHVEGLDIRSRCFTEAAERVEIFITGPFVTELSRDYYRVFVDVHVVLTCRMDVRQKGYNLWTYAGVFQAALDAEVPVYNLGGEPGDFMASDPSSLVHIGCLRPQYGKAIGVTHYGQVHEVDRVQQIECECKYIIELSN